MGNAYAAEYTYSSDFPTTRMASQTVLGGAEDAFVVKLSSRFALMYSTYLGGGSTDIARGIAVDAAEMPTSSASPARRIFRRRSRPRNASRPAVLMLS